MKQDHKMEQDHKRKQEHRIEQDHRMEQEHRIEQDHRMEQEHRIEQDHRMGREHRMEQEQMTGQAIESEASSHGHSAAGCSFPLENASRGAAGMLYLCATPIGNLEDITMRVIRTLKEVDLIAAEDTRGSIRLLNHFGIHTPMTSYHEYNRIEKAHTLIAKMKAGSSIALITDAGTPGISDPGEDLVRLCMEAGIEVTSLPGACACVTALTLSGLPTRRFCFEAFLPSDKKERRRILEELKTETRTTILYEAPHRLVKTLEELCTELGDRRVSVCRELTKKHETVLAGTLSEALDWFRIHEPRGEFVLVLEGRSHRELRKEEQQQWNEMSIPEHVALYEEKGMDRKEAMKQAAKDRGISKREIYAAVTEAKGKL